MVDNVDTSRFVAREIAKYKTDEYFAPSSTTATTRMVDIYASKLNKSRMTLDIARAFLNVPEDEDVLVVPPTVWLRREAEQNRSTEVLWKMRRVLYGRRKAAQAWHEFLAKQLQEEWGAQRCAAAPQLFMKGSVLLEVHVDDVHAAGDHGELEDLAKFLASVVKVKVFTIIPFGSPGGYQHLRRERVLTDMGLLDSTERAPRQEMRGRAGPRQCDQGADNPACCRRPGRQPRGARVARFESS
jgi:hypothetical protein